MHYYQFNIGDYVSSTHHLDEMEDLAYRRMLDLYYSKESPLPKDPKEIARLIRMRPHVECIASVLQEFFVLSADGYRNHGADKVLEKTYDKSEKARQAAKARWSSKNNNLSEKEGDKDAMRTHTERNATQDPLPNTQYPDNYMSSAVAECPHQKIIDLYHSALPSNPRVKVWNDTRKGYLRSRWREEPERQNLDYWKRLFEYIAKSDFLTGRTDQQNRKPFLADLEWIVKPSNFVKIIEGKYES